METIKTIEKNYDSPASREYVKLVQTYDKDEQDDRKYAVEIYLHTSDNRIATIHSSMLCKSDRIFDALMKNYL